MAILTLWSRKLILSASAGCRRASRRSGARAHKRGAHKKSAPFALMNYGTSFGTKLKPPASSHGMRTNAGGFPERVDQGRNPRRHAVEDCSWTHSLITFVSRRDGLEAVAWSMMFPTGVKLERCGGA